MFLTLIFLLIFILLVYIKVKYFTLDDSIPGVAPTLFLGNLIESGQLLHGASLSDAFRNMKNRLGNTYRFWLGPTKMIVVGEAEDVQHIFTHRNIYEQGIGLIEKVGILFPNGLISLQGTAFKRHAEVTIRLFTKLGIISYENLIVQISDRLLNQWRSKPPGTLHTDIPRESQYLLLQIFGHIGFDYDLGVLSENTDDENTKDELTNSLYDMFTMFHFILFAPKFLSLLYTKFSKRYRNARATVEKYINQLVEKELAMSDESRSERKQTCLIASLVSSMQKDSKTPDENRKGLTRQEIIDETLLFLVAGYETTATALSWSIFWLSKHPEVQRKIKDELFEKSAQGDLAYLDRVIKEVLRITPPVAVTQRTLTCDDRLPESGYLLRKGESVLVPIECLAHDTRYWNIDPERFYPDRFLHEDKDHNPYALLPFGSGHRRCIGQDLARFELKVILARLLQHVTFVDGGPELNTGGYSNNTITMVPKKMAVSIEFDS